MDCEVNQYYTDTSSEEESGAESITEHESASVRPEEGDV